MTLRIWCGLVLAVACLVGCDEGGPSGPSGGSSDLVDTWVGRSNATDGSGVQLCSFVSQRLHLRLDGTYDYEVHSVDLPATSECNTSQVGGTAGTWQISQPGFLEFSPNFWGATGDGELAYTLENDQLTLGVASFERE